MNPSAKLLLNKASSLCLSLNYPFNKEIYKPTLHSKKMLHDYKKKVKGKEQKSCNTKSWCQLVKAIPKALLPTSWP